MTAPAQGAAQMVDPQFTVVRVLRPPDDFEANYQGKDATVPIAFPGTVDPRAGTTGFAANLMAAYSVPEGSKVCLWFPVCFADGVSTPTLYSYRLVWRHRPLAGEAPRDAFRQAKIWHIRRSLGAPDGAIVQFAVPASWHVLAYEEVEPSTGAGELRLRVEKITPIIDGVVELTPPVLPDGTPGTVEQGIYDPTVSVVAQVPSYMPFFTDAAGDELIILATRADPDDATWDFTDPDEDQAFSNVYGTNAGARAAPLPGVGIYLQTGVMP